MLDKLDKQIIMELKGNARRSYTDLAKVLQVSEGTVRNRVKSLQKNNVIKLEAVLNPYSIGYNFITIMALEVKVADLSIVADKLAKLPNVYYLAFVTGRYDVVAILMTRSTQELSDFIKENISNIPGILHSETLVNLEVIKSPWANTWDVNQLINLVSDK
ncbi:MAG TPA: Lrp/AsnC family transcriptional regulator [Dehalococcoidia bacterium]|nr:Lrp/AsnC family transcriptional regulator [Dehalococcoidia bacterium]